MICMGILLRMRLTINMLSLSADIVLWAGTGLLDILTYLDRFFNFLAFWTDGKRDGLKYYVAVVFFRALYMIF